MPSAETVARLGRVLAVPAGCASLSCAGVEERVVRVENVVFRTTSSAGAGHHPTYFTPNLSLRRKIFGFSARH